MSNPNWYYQRVFSVTGLAEKLNARSISVIPASVPDADKRLLPDPAQSPYRGVGVGSYVYTEVELQDVFGNRLGNYMPDIKLPVAYYDELISPSAWPGLHISYEILPPDAKHDRPFLKLRLDFDTTPYVADKDDDLVQVKQKAARTLPVYARAFYQVLQSDLRVELSLGEGNAAIPGLLEEILGFLTRCHAFLSRSSQALTRNDLPPKPEGGLLVSIIEGSVGFDTAASVFPLNLRLVFSRDPALIDADFTGEEQVRTVNFLLAPLQSQTVVNLASATTPTTAGNLSLKPFAAQFETAFPGLKLCLSPDSSRQTPRIEVINFSQKGLSFSIAQNTIANSPKYYSMPPLSGKLVNRRQVMIRDFVAGKGLDAAAKSFDFRDVDVDLWMRQVLEFVDVLLGPAYAIAIYKTDPEAFKILVQTKGLLARFLASRVDAILTRDQNFSGLPEARLLFREQLETELGQAYKIDTVVQALSETKGYRPAQKTYALSGEISPSEGVEAPRSLSFSKTSIALSEGNGTATFLCNVKVDSESQEEQYKIDLSFRFYGIVEPGQKERPFVIPMTPGAIGRFEGRLGPVSVPVPLRAYPTVPELKSQEILYPNLVRESKTVSTKKELESFLRDVRSWEYRIEYVDRSAAQDRLYLKLHFNRPLDEAAQTASGGEDSLSFFGDIAQWNHVLYDLREELSKLDKLEPAKAQLAVAALKDISQSLHTAMTAELGPKTAALNIAAGETADPGEIQAYDLEIEFRDKTGYIIKYQRSKAGQDFLSGIRVATSGEKAGALTACTEADVNRDPRFAEERRNGERVFILPPGMDPFTDDLRYECSFDRMDVLEKSSIWTNFEVTRNEELDFEDIDESLRVNPAFVYRTPLVHYPNELTPHIRSNHPVYLKLKDAPGFDAALTALLANLMPRAAEDYRYFVKITCRFAQFLSSSLESLIAQVPVFLIPRFSYGGNGQELSTLVQTQLRRWCGEHKPAENDVVFFFDFCIFVPSDTATLRPSLELNQIALRYRYQEQVL